MRRLPPFPGLIALFLLGGLVGTRAAAQSEPPESVEEPEYEHGQIVLQVGEPTTLDVGDYDDVLSLEPDRLSVIPLTGGRVQLVGGPRSGSAALLVLSGTRAETIVITVAEADRWVEVEDRAAELSRPTYRYRGTLAMASAEEAGPQLSTGHALTMRQAVGDRSWSGELLVTGQQKYTLQRLAAHYAEPGLRLTAGDTSVVLANQQLALSVRGGRAILGNDTLHAGLVGGVQRRGGTRTGTSPQLATLAFTAGGEVGRSWMDGQVGVVTSAEQAPRLATRAGVGYRAGLVNGMVEVATLGTAAAVLLDARGNSARMDLGARMTWQSADMTLTQRTRGSRLRADLSAAYRLKSHWTLTGVGVASHQGNAEGSMFASTTVMGGVGARYQPSSRATGQLIVRSGTVTVGGQLASTHGFNGGFRVEPTSRIYGGADAEFQWTRERSALRHHVRVGYGNRYRASVFATYRGLRQYTGAGVYISERLGLGGQFATKAFDAQMDVGLDHFQTPAESGWRPLVAAASQWQLAEPIQLNLSGFHTVARDKDEAARWRLEAAIQLADSVGGGDGWFGLAGSVSGEVFEDLDGDAVRSANEAVISGLTVTLDDGRTTQTDRRGRFRFGGVQAGTHTVIVDRGTWAVVNGAERTFHLGALGHSVQNVALRPGGHIEGRLFVDGDDDRRYDPDEYGFSVPLVELVDAEGNVVDTAPCHSGLFRFRGVRAGEWTVRVDLADLPAGIVPLAQMDQTFSLSAGTTTTVEFPLRAMRSISGTVWVDVNNSGAWDKADVPAPGVWVHLDDGSVARTNDSGEYLFRDLTPGRYRAWIRGGKRERRVRFATNPDEQDRVDLFIPPDVFENPDPTDLLTIRSVSPVVHAASGQVVADPFVAVHDDLTRTPLQTQRAWSIEDTSVARIEADRLVAGLPGTTVVDVSVDGLPSRPMVLEVTDRPWEDVTVASAVRLDVDPNDALGVVASVGSNIIPMGERVPLAATAVFSDGSVSRLDQNVDWEVSGDGVVTVSPDGWLYATGVGRTVLTARVGDAESTAVDVEVVPDPLVELIVPDQAVRVDVGRGVPLAITGRYGSDRRVDMSGAVRWYSTDSDVIRVTERGTLIAHSIGHARVWAQLGDIESASIEVEVRQRPVVGVTVTAAPVVAVGQDLNAIVTAVTAGGNLRTPDVVRWVSNDPTVVAVGRDGRPVAVGRGRTQVIAELGGARSAPVDVQVKRRRRAPRQSEDRS